MQNLGLVWFEPHMMYVQSIGQLYSRTIMSHLHQDFLTLPDIFITHKTLPSSHPSTLQRRLSRPSSGGGRVPPGYRAPWYLQTITFLMRFISITNIVPHSLNEIFTQNSYFLLSPSHLKLGPHLQSFPTFCLCILITILKWIITSLSAVTSVNLDFQDQFDP